MLRKTVLSLKSPTGAFIAPLRKRELLRIRHFRQCARKDNENFGKKERGLDGASPLDKEKHKALYYDKAIRTG